MSSFSSIVAIIGSILIGVGVLWLVADNWHAIPSAIKIIILLAAIAISFIAAVKLKEKAYNNTATAIFLLGAILYTASVFLIAQIFSTTTSIQGFAWLMLLATVGVIFASYIFESQIILTVGLIETLIWIIGQFMAFSEYVQGSFGMMSLWFLGAGLLLYGLYLLHAAKNHAFDKTYRLFCTVYFLLFAFILSFQLTIGELWRVYAMTNSIVIFAIVLGILGLATTSVGIYKKMPDRKEVIGITVLTILLLSIIALAVIPETTAEKNNALPQSTNGYCMQKSCYSYNDESACKSPSAVQKGCIWQNNMCAEPNCYQYSSRDACLANDAMRCNWVVQQNVRAVESCKNGICSITKSNDSAYTACETTFNNYDQKISDCSSLNSTSCLAKDMCTWQDNYYGGDYGRTALFTRHWFIWIWANLVLLAAILGIIAYGTWQHEPKIINIGIIFFALMIISRYIGFIIDYGNYTSMSVLFIVGGLILIGGGFYLEKLRRKLVVDAKPVVKSKMK